jgi:hypothetical protein
MPALEPFVTDLEARAALAHANLTLVPLAGGEGHGPDYRLAAEALGAGLLALTETSEAGTVPELLATTTAEVPVLLLDGEELVGAKQNRILNAAVLLPARAKTVIPVSCVEQGRWRHVGRDFRPGTVSPSRMRARKGRDVHLSLRARGRHESDQAGVWDEVQEELADLGAASPTMAMHDAVRHRERDLAAFRDALPYPDGARGVFVAVGDRFAAVDLFDRAATLDMVWPRLVTGYAMDALGRRGRTEPAFQPKGPKAILERLGQIACEPYASPGLGQDLRFAAEDLTGHALVVDDACITLSAFPNDGCATATGRDTASTQEPSSPRIQPPSKRGRK